MTDTLRDAVEAQAKAHVAGDIATFASFLTPQALLQLRELDGGDRPRAFRVVEVEEQEERGVSDVEYRGRTTYVLRQRWQRDGDTWRSVEARRPAESVRVPFWRRLFGRAAP